MVGRGHLRLVLALDGIERGGAARRNRYYSDILLPVSIHAPQGDQRDNRRRFYNPGGCYVNAPLAGATAHIFASTHSRLHRHPGDVPAAKSEPPETATAPNCSMG